MRYCWHMSYRHPIIKDMAGAVVPQPCTDIAVDADGAPVVLVSGERLCCGRTDGHFPRHPHADLDDGGRLVEWR